MAKIYLKFNAAVIKEIKVTKEDTTFGRKPGNDIVIDHPTISGFHGKIHRSGDEWSVEDLNSTNGTFVNGRRVKTSTLKNKDQIGAAGHVLEFYLDDTVLKVDGDAATDPGAVPAAAPAAPPAPAPAAKAASPAASPDLEKQKELLKKSLMGQLKPAAPAPGASAPAANRAEAPAEPGQIASNGAAPNTSAHGHGVLRIVSGGVNGQAEIILKELVTYIGTSDQAVIKIKGFLAPSLAAAISRRPEGYFLKAVKPGYPKVNGNPVKEQIFLENGALIEVAGTNMVFYHSGSKKNESTPSTPTKQA